MEAPESNCYCCTERPTKPSGMDLDLDTALNELGMLSSVTESRRQYLRELRSQGISVRNRNLSESSLAIPSTAATPANSPSRGVYQVVQLNTQFVTSLSSGVVSSQGPQHGNCSSNRTVDPAISFGAKYCQDELEKVTKSNRHTRVKQARVKRFKKPYEVPWRVSLENCFSGGNQTTLPEFNTPEKSIRLADRICNSNSSTPEKTGLLSEEVVGQVTRSRSLDELDFAKLRLAEAENHNLILQKQEIENVSQHLRNLQVTE